MHALQAGDELVVLEVESANVCETGLIEEADLNWKEDQEAALKPCQDIKHVFARTARDSPDVTFLALEVAARCGARAPPDPRPGRPCSAPCPTCRHVTPQPQRTTLGRSFP